MTGGDEKVRKVMIELLVTSRRGLEALEDVGCQFFACKGPERPEEEMATCRVCAAIRQLRKAIAKGEAMLLREAGL